MEECESLGLKPVYKLANSAMDHISAAGNKQKITAAILAADISVIEMFIYSWQSESSRREVIGQEDY